MTTSNEPTSAQVYIAANTNLEARRPGINGTCAYRHIPGPPINDLWWLRHGYITDVPYPGPEEPR